MNKKPNMSGISRYWKKGEDDRRVLARVMRMNPDDETNRNLIDFMLEGILKTVKSRKRTKFVGFGVFEWIPWNNRLPTGQRVETWRLTFKPGQHVKGRYHGDR